MKDDPKDPRPARWGSRATEDWLLRRIEETLAKYGQGPRRG